MLINSHYEKYQLFLVFTGIIEEIGTCVVQEYIETSLRLQFRAVKVLNELNIGDSIAVNGVCLTVTYRSASVFEVIAVSETLKKTTLSSLKIGDNVNLERAATLATRLGGHLVQGHIDTTAVVSAVKEVGGGSYEFTLTIPHRWMRYIIPKGSIAVDGVSLTVAETSLDTVTIAIIPHTYGATTFQYLRVGSNVNIEFDCIAKMVESLLKYDAELSGGQT